MNFTVLEYQKINHKVTQSLILWQLVNSFGKLGLRLRIKVFYS